jgi:hypothetical protein
MDEPLPKYSPIPAEIALNNKSENRKAGNQPAFLFDVN